jgi:hypothetical protein
VRAEVSAWARDTGEVGAATPGGPEAGGSPAAEKPNRRRRLRRSRNRTEKPRLLLQQGHYGLFLCSKQWEGNIRNRKGEKFLGLKSDRKSSRVHNYILNRIRIGCQMLRHVNLGLNIEISLLELHPVRVDVHSYARYNYKRGKKAYKKPKR